MCVTLAVNFERFYAIVFPLKHFRWKRYLLPAAVTFAVAYNVPKFFEMELVVDPETGQRRIGTTSLRYYIDALIEKRKKDSLPIEFGDGAYVPPVKVKVKATSTCHVFDRTQTLL